ncbi:hypothetical protein MPH_07244 [Macrophomina phaseolina MS6]|uniref:DUF6697 domain-containing protein n=1 Tax=Macrophomina phaseolina (strain MS6) TaxID=1126212 RepID=K2RLM5_MACPH|nr:hypothetical protein MPH_07244 [Macrophomina phaseolina MS6]
MAYNKNNNSNSLNRPRGMQHSTHASHSWPVPSSAGGSLNPTAGIFNPHGVNNTNGFTLTHSHNPSQTKSTSLVPHNPKHDEDGYIQVTMSELTQLTEFFNEEIISLRQDIETLKQGDWTVTVGAFHPPRHLDLSQVEATRNRLQNSSGLLGLLESRSHFLSPIIATNQQIDASPTPHLTPARSATIAPAVQPPIQAQASTSSTNSTQRSNGGLRGSKYASNGAEPEPDEGHTQHSITSLPTHPDIPMPSREDPSFTHMSSAGDWQPLVIRSLRPLASDIVHSIPKPSDMCTFTWDFLRKFLLGKWWSPGFYYHAVSEGASIIPSRSYYLLDPSNDPYVPREPGAHGAKLTAFFNPENPEDMDGDSAATAFHKVPVFVKASAWACRHNVATDATSDGSRYVYMGMYSQLRYSDKLDYDRIVEHVPDAIKMYWADQLTDVGRPAWVTEALMKAFEPKPEYEGPLPGAGEDDVVRKEVGTHVRGLKDWQADARKRVAKLTKEDVLMAFGREDAADPPGLRLWWEYLECVGWERGFYELLVREHDKWLAKEKQVDADRVGW